MGYETGANWCWLDNRYEFYLKDLSFEYPAENELGVLRVTFYQHLGLLS